MSKQGSSSQRRDWTMLEVKKLRHHSLAGTPVSLIANDLRRTASSLRQKAYELGIPLGRLRRSKSAPVRLQAEVSGQTYMAPNGNVDGRIIKVALFGGHPQAAFYVVAEPDTAKAIGIMKAAIEENYDEFEDVGRASKALLAALNLKPGEFRKT